MRTQQHRLATETMVNWMLGELENVKASMAPYKPPSTALIPFPLAKAMQWQLTSLYETHECFFFWEGSASSHTHFVLHFVVWVLLGLQVSICQDSA